MAVRRAKKRQRYRIGRVSYYRHHGAWWTYYQENGKKCRKRIGHSREEAERVAAQINAQLLAAAPTILSFQSISVVDLRSKFLQHHEDVLRSSVGTVCRYRTATQHLVDFVASSGSRSQAHQLHVANFVAFLGTRQVAPNGHPNTPTRRLRDKGVLRSAKNCVRGGGESHPSGNVKIWRI